MANKKDEELGKYFLDLSKLVFAGLVLSIILTIDNYFKFITIAGGIISTYFFAKIGLMYIAKSV